MHHSEGYMGSMKSKREKKKKFSFKTSSTVHHNIIFFQDSYLSTFFLPHENQLEKCSNSYGIARHFLESTLASTEKLVSVFVCHSSALTARRLRMENEMMLPQHTK